MKKVLIANRGEVALRIQATCHSFGIKTVAIYTEEDQYLSYVFKAGESYKLSLSGAAGYMAQDEIISIAIKSGADSIHPGYGFLSEKSEFAQKVIDAGLTWIGPTPKNIALLGDKAVAQKTMISAGIPTVPGYSIDVTVSKSFGQAKLIAISIGFPIVLKCAHGGGGKAMRHVENVAAFDDAWNTVVSESEKLFFSTIILIEKYLEKPRHIEVQIAGDGEEYIHLYERECSIQRHHQKIIEEAPCSFISQETKEKLYAAALQAARAVNYKNIGTVEFLVTGDPVSHDEKFFFLEMNTRLQVEHSITEAITGRDLVFLQLYIARHGRLPYKQQDITKRGHAIECRIYSEDNNFVPSTGTINNLIFPSHPVLRIDHDLSEGQEITPFFDPMLVRLTTVGDDRSVSIAHMKQVLSRLHIDGVNTNGELLKAIMDMHEFLKGEIHTQLLKSHFLEKCLEQIEKSSEIPFSSEEQKILTDFIMQNNQQNFVPSQRTIKREWRNQLWR
jgi:acetyl-CoA carboxylase, biotin carboxylase subunit